MQFTVKLRSFAWVAAGYGALLSRDWVGRVIAAWIAWHEPDFTVKFGGFLEKMEFLVSLRSEPAVIPAKAGIHMVQL